MLNIAAIDVGSNAMRMVVGEVDETWQVTQSRIFACLSAWVRMFLARGFLRKKRSSRPRKLSFVSSIWRKVSTFIICVQLLPARHREAENSDLLLERVFRTSGIEIEIISGEEEARLIHLAVVHELKLKTNALY